MTISDISFLYKISQPAIKSSVAAAMGIRQRGGEILEKFMHSMTIIRNLCAHGSRLYNRLFEQRPKLSRQELDLLVRNADGEVDNSHLYGFIILMRRLLQPEEFAEMKNEIVALTKKYPFVNMRYYGFREDWESVL